MSVGCRHASGGAAWQGRLFISLAVAARCIFNALVRPFCQPHERGDESEDGERGVSAISPAGQDGCPDHKSEQESNCAGDEVHQSRVASGHQAGSGDSRQTGRGRDPASSHVCLPNDR